MTEGAAPAVHRAVLVGEVLAAFLAEADLPLGESVAFSRTFAGAESNTAIALSRLGVATRFVGRVGDDALGRAAVRHLRGEGVDVAFLRADPAAPTALLARGVSPSGAEVVYGRTGSAGSRVHPDDVSEAAMAGADLLHLTGITPMLSADAATACERAVDLARAEGAIIGFDPNLRLRMAPVAAWRATLTPFLGAADVVLVGADEATALTGDASARDAAEALQRAGGAVVVVKDGARGASAYDGCAWHVVEAVPTRVVDPVGAGDAFDAGFLASWLRGRDLLAALRHGAELGAMSVSARGDTSGIADPVAVSRRAGDVVR